MQSDRLRVGFLAGFGPFLALGTVLAIGGCDDPDHEKLGHRSGASGMTGGWSTAGCELAREPQNVAVGEITQPATPAKLDAAMARIDQAGRADFPTSYAGLEVDQERVRALVYRVPSDAFDDVIRRAAEDTCIVVRDSAYSIADLAVWHDRVVADLPFWTDRGIRIVTIGARHDGSGVEIGTQDVDRARLELPARYGSRAPLLFVEQGPVVPLHRPGVRAAVPPPR